MTSLNSVEAAAVEIVGTLFKVHDVASRSSSLSSISSLVYGWGLGSVGKNSLGIDRACSMPSRSDDEMARLKKIKDLFFRCGAELPCVVRGSCDLEALFGEAGVDVFVQKVDRVRTLLSGVRPVGVLTVSDLTL